MELLSDFLKLIVPAGLVLYGMYLTVKLLLEREADRHRYEVQTRYTESVVPVRLQAYERMVLFLERISPNNLLLRLGGSATTVLEFQQRLLGEIRDEYNHNLSQQVYMSQAVWDQIQAAMNEVTTLINQASGDTRPDAPALDLSKRIFERIIEKDRLPTANALNSRTNAPDCGTAKCACTAAMSTHSSTNTSRASSSQSIWQLCARQPGSARERVLCSMPRRIATSTEVCSAPSCV